MLTLKQQEILKQNDLFTDFNEAELAQIIAKTSYHELKKKQHFFVEGQPARHFFLAIYGSIKLSFLSPRGDEKVMDIIGAGNTFAEAVMFLNEKTYPVSATALKDSGVLQIDAQGYLNILEKSPKACFKIMARLSKRLHWSLTEIKSLSLHDGTYRLLKFLLNNAQQTGKTTQIDLLVTKNILASQLSVQPETLSRILNKLSNDGLLSVNNNRITLLRPVELKNIVSN